TETLAELERIRKERFILELGGIRSTKGPRFNRNFNTSQIVNLYEITQKN
ncbi:MAG: hypothetical protein ACI9G1_006009, partial [Pirellulaceae bacterium]